MRALTGPTALLVALAVAGDAAADDDAAGLAARLAAAGLVDVRTLAPAIQVELKYSTADNFLGADVYGDLDACYLNPDAARMLARAADLLAERAPNLRLHVYDCVRPVAVQKKMWALVKGTPKRAYVANPYRKVKGMHNYGCAVDLTLADESGAPVDMGTPFDHFGPEAEPRRELRLLAAGRLSAAQVSSRLQLRRVMVDAGFLPLDNEWWHFDCATGRDARARYRIVP